MASNQVYMQRMFSDMQGTITSMEETIADLQTDMSGISTKMDNQITELQNIVSAVASVLTQVNVKPGSAVSFNVGNAVLTKTSTTYIDMGVSIACLASGAAELNFKGKSGHTSYTVTFGYSLDGGVTIIDLVTLAGSTTYATVSKNIAVQPGKIIRLYGKSTNQAVIDAGIQIKYDFNDIALNGPFVAGV